jgi:2,5-diketo-D-gluconate reductase B
MCLTAYSPLAQGRLLNDAVLQAIGQKHSKTVCQVALRWLIQQGQVMAIPRSSKLEHAKENLDIFDFALSDDDMKTIDQLTQNQVRVINPEHLAPDWD